jgi:hypothetical protein
LNKNVLDEMIVCTKIAVVTFIAVFLIVYIIGSG